MKDITLIGIDPGLVDTGLVSITFKPQSKEIILNHDVASGVNGQPPSEESVQKKIALLAKNPDLIVIEDYKPRSNFGTDVRMVSFVALLHKAIPGSIKLLNMGVKKLITRDLMILTDTWKWSTRTNHDDIRSAARIALLGMAKDEELNKVLSQVVADHLEGNTWTTTHY